MRAHARRAARATPDLRPLPVTVQYRGVVWSVPKPYGLPASPPAPRRGPHGAPPSHPQATLAPPSAGEAGHNSPESAKCCDFSLTRSCQEVTPHPSNITLVWVHHGCGPCAWKARWKPTWARGGSCGASRTSFWARAGRPRPGARTTRTSHIDFTVLYAYTSWEFECSISGNSTDNSERNSAPSTRTLEYCALVDGLQYFSIALLRFALLSTIRLYLIPNSHALRFKAFAIARLDLAPALWNGSRDSAQRVSCQSPKSARSGVQNTKVGVLAAWALSRFASEVHSRARAAARLSHPGHPSPLAILSSRR